MNSLRSTCPPARRSAAPRRVVRALDSNCGQSIAYFRNQEAAVGSVTEERIGPSRLWASVLAAVLLIQSAFLVVTIHRNAIGQWSVAPVCSASSSIDESGRPAAPSSGAQHGLCCILHCAIVNAPPQRDVALVALSRPAEIVPVTSSYPGFAPRVSVKGAPQSPRPPPAQA
jgi:hypothetical protein